jgi:hypothetical protein
MTSLLDAPPAVLGDQLPRIWTAPPALSSAGDEAVGLAAEAGLILDPWQAWVLDRSLGEKAGGKWAAFEIGLVVGRQNGKGSILEARELAGLFLFGEELILHTAHQFKTSAEAFARVRALVENTDSLRKRVRRVLTGKGDEAIELRSGQRLRFIARSGVSGRGFSGDLVILDEAFELPEHSMSALIPTMSARSVTGNPQIWYTSSSVNQAEHKQGHVLARVRRRALKGDSRLMYAEWSAAERDGLKEPELAALRVDRGAWARANPGLGLRISEEFVEFVELATLAARSFEVERLGIGDWPVEDVEKWAVISKPLWLSRQVPPPSRLENLALAVAASWPDAERCSIGAAAVHEGRLMVQAVDSRPGRAWVPGRLAELTERFKPCAVVVRDRGPTAALHAELKAADVDLVTPWVKESATAFRLFNDAVTQGEPLPLGHFGQPELDAAVAAAKRKPAGDGWVWDQPEPELEAVTLAAWGHSTRAHLLADYDVLDSVR